MYIKGKGVSPGIAIAPLRHFSRVELTSAKQTIQDVEAEVQRFESARALAATQLGQLSVELAHTLGEEQSLLFQIHQMMLEDLDYRESVDGIIRGENANAEYAVSETSRIFARMMSEMDDEYMQARAADVQDVSRRVLEILSSVQVDSPLTGGPVILFSDDFAPSETARFNRDVVKGLITSAGSSNSHTAIFARTMGIPAVIGVGQQLDGMLDDIVMIVDGDAGDVIVAPAEAQMEEYRERLLEFDRIKDELERYRNKPTITPGGKKIKLYANIGNAADAAAALENDAEGVGLFRSEFLYLESADYPGEETQFEVYKSVAEKMAGKQVIIRTLDIGADKQADYFRLPHEDNPALGMRAVRICLTRPEIFKTQLRALFRASSYGEIGIMIPMITSADELIKVKNIMAEVKESLSEENIPFNANTQIGIMIETPAAAIISDFLAHEVDFFSIGTNDLTQYTLAVDRMNDSVAEFFDPYHESVLRLIQMTVDNAHKAGIGVGICGELGADMALTRRFIEMGIDELSVAPPAILPLRKHIAEMDL